MIERVLVDKDGNTLLTLWRHTREQALFVKNESLPDLIPIGASVEVPGTGQKIFIGERRPRAGQISVSLGTHGKSHADSFALQREIISILPEIAGYVRVPGGTLLIAGYSSVKRSFSGSPQMGGTVELTLECASPYFWTDAGPQALNAGETTVSVNGVAPTGLRLELTAAQPVVNPTIRTDAGVTTWSGTLSPGQSLVLDSRRGWSATLDGGDVSLQMTGQLPSLEPGKRTVTLSAGLSGQILWREGEL